MGTDEAALMRIWREKRGEAEPEDLSDNLIVQLGLVTEPLNRHWFERNTGYVITQVQRQVRHPVLRWMAATLDGMVEAPAQCSKRNSCCRGRSRRRRRRRSTWPSSSTTCGSPMPPPRCSRLSPAEASGSRSRYQPIRSISTFF